MRSPATLIPCNTRNIAFRVILALCLSVVVFSCLSQRKMMTIYFDSGCLDPRDVCLDTLIYATVGTILDTIISDLCECLDTVIIEDVNLRVKRGAITDFPGGCLDGRRTGSGWLLTGIDTLWFSCDEFFLRKGGIFYETTVDTASLRIFTDFLWAYEDEYNRINNPGLFREPVRKAKYDEHREK
jgi:hypothetical protein